MSDASSHGSAQRLRAYLPAAHVALVLLLAGFACKDDEIKPKYADHEAAHRRRYHPAVDRSGADTRPEPTTSPAPAGTTATRPNPFGSPVLFVNRQTITVQDVLEPILDDLLTKAEGLPLPTYQGYVQREVAQQIDFQIGLAVVYEQAQLSYTEARFEEAFQKEAERMVRDVINRRFGGVRVRYEQHLKRLDLTMDDITERAKRQVMVMQFLRDRFQPATHEPTRRELMNYYQAHLDAFTTPPRAELFLLEIPLEESLGKPIDRASGDELAEARREARARLEEARSELARGTDFAQVARTYCQGVRARAGGAWGPISPGALTGRWAKAGEVLFSLEPGRHSEIVETDDALFVVKCGQRTPASTLSFEEAQQQILQRIAEEEFDRRRDAYIAQLVARAMIRRRDEFHRSVLSAVGRAVRAARQPASLSR